MAANMRTVSQYVMVLGDRLEAIDKRQVQSPLTTNFAKPANGAAKPPTIIRCDGCGAPYEGTKMPVGSANLCPECSRPGSWMTRCVSCGNPFYTTEPKQIEVKEGKKKVKKPNELKCRSCKKCKLCGSQEWDFVCAQCVKDGARICEFCARLAMAGGYCIEHSQVPGQQTAAHFDETLATPPPNQRTEFGGTQVIGAAAPVTGGIYLGGAQ